MVSRNASPFLWYVYRLARTSSVRLDHRELERLQEKAESAHELLEKYSKHLGSEVRDRISMVHMLKSYINHHRAELSRAEEQLTVCLFVLTYALCSLSDVVV